MDLVDFFGVKVCRECNNSLYERDGITRDRVKGESYYRRCEKMFLQEREDTKAVYLASDLAAALLRLQIRPV
jgi:hypothetical protein